MTVLAALHELASAADDRLSGEVVDFMARHFDGIALATPFADSSAGRIMRFCPDPTGRPAAEKRAFAGDILRRTFQGFVGIYLVAWLKPPFESDISAFDSALRAAERIYIAPRQLETFTERDLEDVPLIELVLDTTFDRIAVDPVLQATIREASAPSWPWDVFFLSKERPIICHVDAEGCTDVLSAEGTPKT